MKKLIIAGGNGFLGNILIDFYRNKATEIVVLTRSGNTVQNGIIYQHWDAKTLGNWQQHLEDADVLLNLTGKSVDCRYHQRNKDLIMRSRVDSTKILNEAILLCENPPKVWLNSSTATIYRHSMDREMDELTGEIGSGFSVNVAKAWEKAFFETKLSKTRKVALRTSIVLGKNGGALAPIVNLAKYGFGGKQGSGKQFFSWIHEQDFVRAINFIINNNEIEGIINIVAPKPSDNKSLMKTIQKQQKRPLAIPLPKTLLEIGAFLIKTETELILKSRRVVPKKLLENGFIYDYPNLKTAVDNLLNRT